MNYICVPSITHHQGNHHQPLFLMCGGLRWLWRSIAERSFFYLLSCASGKLLHRNSKIVSNSWQSLNEFHYEAAEKQSCFSLLLHCPFPALHPSPDLWSKDQFRDLVSTSRLVQTIRHYDCPKQNDPVERAKRIKEKVAHTSFKWPKYIWLFSPLWSWQYHHKIVNKVDQNLK